MPYIRRRGVRKVGRKRVGAVRRRMMRRPMRGIRQPVQFFKRTAYYPGWITGSTLNDTFSFLIGYLNQMPNYTDFTQLYDQYQIKGLKATLIPRWNTGTLDNSLLTSPTYSCLDYDDNSPTSLNDMLQYQNLKMKRGTSLHSRYFKPAVTPLIYQGLTSGYEVRKNVWLDCSNDQVPHYGVTFCIPQLAPLTGDAVYKYDLKVDYYVAFKNVR